MITDPDGGTTTYTYDGSLLTGARWSGAVSGSIGYAYDNDFRVTTETVNGANAISFSYDADSLLTAAGALSIRRDAQTGFVTGTTLGNVTDAWTYNAFGEPVSYSASYSGTPWFAQVYTRDDAGRIAARTETVLATMSTYVYGYDTAGRLTTVTQNGTQTASYAYDSNSSRLTKTTPSTTETGTYDAQDQMLTYAGATYTYSANGELQMKTDATGTTSYVYDASGNLRKVTLPNSGVIDYVIDAQNRRVGKKVNGTLVQGFLYGDQLRIVAELDGAGNVVSRFVYGTRSNVPDFMIKGGTTYRIISDHLGSPRLVVNVGTGAIAQTLGYDEFGNVLADSAPGFQPFGFAGGLYDRDTKLVRLGARDYDAGAARWTAKDPILFGGGSANLYGYSANDPINFFDPNGLEHVKEPGFTKDLSEADWSDAPPVIKAVFYAEGILMLVALPETTANLLGDLWAVHRVTRQGQQANSCPRPPGWNKDWQYRAGSRGKNPKSWWDPEGGEWRWHEVDRHHPEPHWDYNPWNEWNTP